MSSPINPSKIIRSVNHGIGNYATRNAEFVKSRVLDENNKRHCVNGKHGTFNDSVAMITKSYGYQCHNCGRYGHKRSECRVKGNGERCEYQRSGERSEYQRTGKGSECYTMQGIIHDRNATRQGITHDRNIVTMLIGYHRMRTVILFYNAGLRRCIGHFRLLQLRGCVKLCT